MKAKIAVATVSGKAYYLIVNELKRRNLAFVSLTPDEPIPIEVEVVLTTDAEKKLVNHDNVLILKNGNKAEDLVNEAVRIVRGKENYEKVVVGVDPGEVTGVAVLAVGKVVETRNCYSMTDTLNAIEAMVKDLQSNAGSSISVKIGDGVHIYKERLLQALDKNLPHNVRLESVVEAGTNSRLNEATHRRGLRDIMSAIQIAQRSGQPFRRKHSGQPQS